jgi:hypothetical protein
MLNWKKNIILENKKKMLKTVTHPAGLPTSLNSSGRVSYFKQTILWQKLEVENAEVKRRKKTEYVIFIMLLHFSYLTLRVMSEIRV